MIDELDSQIINELSKDAGLSYSEIARALNQNESTIRKRVIAMKEKGVIKKFSCVLDHLKVGYNTVAIVGLDVDPSLLLDVAQRLADMSATKYVATSTGDHMLMTEVWAKDGRELAQILSKMGAIVGVKKLCPAILLEKIKE
jgi:Lrp/AsnC family transcriptional regulator for asnA, asnC and gidA